MKSSFHRRLFAAFLFASLVPLLVSSALLIHIFRLRMNGETEREAQSCLDAALSAMDSASDGFSGVCAVLRESTVLRTALVGGSVSSTRVYNELFRASEGMRDYASFDVYDASGVFRWSTQSLPRAATLPTDWGALGAAAQNGAQALRFFPCEDGSGALLRGAAALHDANGGVAGYLVIQIYDAHLRALFGGRYGAQNDLLLLSPYWRGVFATEQGLADTLAPLLRERLLVGGTLGGDEPFLYTAARHEPDGYCLVLRQPEMLTKGTIRMLYTVAATSALICVALSVVLGFQFSSQISLPIRRLEEAFSRVERGDLGARVTGGGSDELSRLGEQFNGTVEALARNQAALLENQRELDETQIRMLQAQLNPHFLGNTLDTMKWISKINKVPQVAAMSTDLADILRFAISPDELVPLRREAEILERYVDIQKIRLTDGFSFRLSIPAELEDCLVPKMILQPLVENAILHGLEGVENGGVEVTARADGDVLYIRVADSGRGFPAEMAGAFREQDETRSRGHLGLYNVDMILRKYYGGDSGLYLENPAGGGAAVTATLPLRREEESVC